MNAKDLEKKAINIKGKEYVLVSDRVLFFNENCPDGSIQTEIVKYENKQIIVKATVFPNSQNPDRKFIGHAQEIEDNGYINKTSALENAETSAVGRALGMLGIGVLESIASADEIVKAQNRSNYNLTPTATAKTTPTENGNCPKCGAPMKISKTGGKYCSALCWVNNFKK